MILIFFPRKKEKTTLFQTNENDAVEPALGVGVQAQVALRRRQDERHGHHVHLLAGAHEAAHHQQEIVESPVTYSNFFL